MYWTSIYLGGKEGQIIGVDTKLYWTSIYLGGKEVQIIKVVLDQYLLGGKRRSNNSRAKKDLCNFVVDKVDQQSIKSTEENFIRERGVSTSIGEECKSISISKRKREITSSIEEEENKGERE